MNAMSRAALLALLSLGPTLTATAALAQTAGIALGGAQSSVKEPVEITAETLRINNADGTALFTGDVKVAQGEMRMAAPEVRVEYAPGTRKIDRLHATGGVTLLAGPDAAEGKEAVYDLTLGTIVMTGDVLLSQVDSALSGQKLTIRLDDNTGVMEGGVSSTFLTGDN